MKPLAALFICLALGVLGFSQDSTAHQGMSSMGQAGQPSGMGMHDMHGMANMHTQMMNDMQADLDSMRSTLQKMKDGMDKVSDRATKDQLQLNINLWQSLIDHMEKHMAGMRKMMNSHHEPPPATPKQ